MSGFLWSAIVFHGTCGRTQHGSVACDDSSLPFHPPNAAGIITVQDHPCHCKHTHTHTHLRNIHTSSFLTQPKCMTRKFEQHFPNMQARSLDGLNNAFPWHANQGVLLVWAAQHFSDKQAKCPADLTLQHFSDKQGSLVGLNNASSPSPPHPPCSQASF